MQITMHAIKQLSILVALTGLLASGNAEARVIYVNAAGTSPSSNGTSWQNAFISLQGALDGLTISDGNALGPAADIFFKPFTYVIL